MPLRPCEHCKVLFEAPTRSETKFCCVAHRKAHQSAVMSEIGKRFDTAKARSARTPESFEKQRNAQLNNHRVIHTGPPEGWFASQPLDMQAKLRWAMGKGRLNVGKAVKSGVIYRHGEWFHTHCEVFVYENLRKRGFAVVRSYEIDDWIVDFQLPGVPIMLEIKSWYTAEHLQGYEKVRSRFRDDVLFVEEQDAYKMDRYEDVISYLTECSRSFKSQIMAYANNHSAA